MGRRAVIRLRYVNIFEDRHKVERAYFRRNGKRVALPTPVGSPAFMAAYNALVAAAASEEDEPTKRAVAPAAGTIAALVIRYFGSPQYLRLAPSSRVNYRRVLEGFAREHGSKRVANLQLQHIDAIMGKLAGKPGAAIVLLKRIRTLLHYARKIGWMQHDPTSDATTYRSSAFHTWTEDEIAAFEIRWPIGTKQRLAFALLLYTGQRGSDVHRLTWPTAAGFSLTQRKTGTSLTVPVHPSLAAVLAETKREQAVVLTTAFGRPFTLKGFGQFMSDAIHKAGLPERCKAHGLRKALARRLAESDATAKQIMAVTGHKTMSEVERYTAAANQPKLAKVALEKHAGNTGVATPEIPSGNPLEKTG